MSSDLQQVAHRLIAALDEMPRVLRYLQDMARRCRDNAAYVGGMSDNPAAQRAAMQLDDAARRCEEAAGDLAQVPPKARDWAEQMVRGIRLSDDGSRQGGDGSPPNGSAKRLSSNDRDSVEPAAREILERLPLRKAGDKTRGIWIDSSGHENDLISGVDEYSADVDRFIEDRQIRIAPGADTLGSHVEIKFALRMRRQGLIDETIIINNRPCPGPYGCHRNLWKFLPEGARLTVYGPDNFKRTYPE